MKREQRAECYKLSGGLGARTSAPLFMARLEDMSEALTDEEPPLVLSPLRALAFAVHKVLIAGSDTSATPMLSVGTESGSGENSPSLPPNSSADPLKQPSEHSAGRSAAELSTCYA